MVYSSPLISIGLPITAGSAPVRAQYAWLITTERIAASGFSSSAVKVRPKRGRGAQRREVARGHDLRELSTRGAVAAIETDQGDRERRHVLEHAAAWRRSR